MFLECQILQWRLVALSGRMHLGFQQSPLTCSGKGEGSGEHAGDGPGWRFSREEMPVPITHIHHGGCACLHTRAFTVSLQSEDSATGGSRADLDGHRKHRCHCCHGDQKRPFLRGSGGGEGFGGWRKGTGKDESRCLERLREGNNARPQRGQEGLRVTDTRVRQKSRSPLDPEAHERKRKIQRGKAATSGMRNTAGSRQGLLLGARCLQRVCGKGETVFGCASRGGGGGGGRRPAPAEKGLRLLDP